jgi:peptide deformylase
MLELVKDNDPVLKENTVEWVFDHPQSIADAQFIEEAMIKTMEANNGIGLAANQVGLTRRVFVMRPSNAEPFGLFNPKIISVSEETQTGQEGCLSFPDLWLEVARPNQVTAEYIDKDGKERTIQLMGLDARVFLHELDHLNGVCFTNKVSPLKLALAKKKQLKKKRKINGRTK